MMISAITEGVRVSVTVEYQHSFSVPEKDHFVFAYRIAIENNSDWTVQLMRRHWFVHDAGHPVREVEGEGVVGVLPVLEPGEQHVYVSGCNIISGIGKMTGYYTFNRVIDDQPFQVRIPEFNLIAPFFLN